MYQVESRLWLPRLRTEVFQFFSDAKNLQKITPPWLDFRVVGMTTPQIGQGTKIDYRLKIRGLPVKWQSEIIVWDPPYRFVDRQVRGPYAAWNHEHRFEERDGGTECTDTIEYFPPGGIVAPLIDRLFVARDVRQIFEFRREQLASIFPP